MNTGHHHSEDVKTLVKSLWARGDSQQEISRVAGVSRNAIGGLIRRLGLPRRERAPAAPRGWVAHKIAAAKPPKPQAPTPIGPIGDFPAGNTCRHIAGEPNADFQCCGHAGFPFCEYHAKRIYVAGRQP